MTDPIDLGTLGGRESCGTIINDDGVVLGQSHRNGGSTVENGFVWDPSNGMVDVNPARQDTLAVALNANGTAIAGTTMRYADGTLIDLEQLIAENLHPTAINDLGHIGGSFFDGQTLEEHAFVWDPVAGLHDLGTFAGFGAQVVDLNERGQAVGRYQSALYGSGRGFFWDPATGLTDLGTFVPSGGLARRHRVMNDAAQVIGRTPQGAVIWRPDIGFTEVTGLGSGPRTSLTAINEHGHVVGSATPTPNGIPRAMFWSPETGMLDMGRAGEGWDLNDHGQAIGYSWLGPAFLWDPVGGATDLPPVPGISFPRPTPQSLNNVGQVVGCVQVLGFEFMTYHAAIWTVSTSIQIHWTAAEYARLQQISSFYGSTPSELPKVGVAALAFIIGLIPSPAPTPVVLDPAGTDTTQTIVWQPDELPFLEAVKTRFALDDEDAHRFAIYLLGYLAAIQGH